MSVLPDSQGDPELLVAQFQEDGVGAGDEALRALALRIRSAVRNQDAASRVRAETVARATAHGMDLIRAFTARTVRIRWALDRWEMDNRT